MTQNGKGTANNNTAFLENFKVNKGQYCHLKKEKRASLVA